MLRKILLVLVLVGIVAIVGCKKEEPTPSSVMDSMQQQAGEAADQAAKDADAAKEEAGKQLEEAGKTLQK